MTTTVTPDLTKTTLATTAQVADPTQAAATGYDPAKWNVDSNQTVQGQIQGIIANNSPLMQMARTSALQGMNNRGILNSSMAIGEADKAVYQAALPIAQADANVNSQAAQTNTNAANAAGQFKASADNQTSQFNANAQNQVNQFNTQQQNAQEQYNVGQINDQVKTTLDQNNKVALMGIEADYKTLMQANQSADSIYQQTVKNIADIQGNKDIDATTKGNMIQQQMTYLQTGMSLISKLNNLPGLADLIKTS